MGRRALLLAIGLIAVAAGILLFAGRSVEAPAQMRAGGGNATAIFAGGCFWCTEADFDAVEGVRSTLSGYTGGHVVNPDYAQVSAGGTGHIEAVRLVYDPAQVDYAGLVDRFFRTIDPHDSGGSFCDRGYQYRSAIFVATAQERQIAEAAKARVERQLNRPVATLILPRQVFYRAEAYHQDYYRKNPVRYRFYRWNCGRDARLREIWEPGR